MTPYVDPHLVATHWHWAAAGAVYVATVVALAGVLRRQRRHRVPRDPRALDRASVIILGVVAAAAAALSYDGVLAAVPDEFGPLRYVVPLLVDAAILGCAMRFIALVKRGRPAGGWRVSAHAGAASTIYLNLLAAPSLDRASWHLIAPVLWSGLVELGSRDVLGELRAVRRQTADRIPLRLWITNFEESARASWRLARTGQTDATSARAETQRCAAVRDVLVTVMPAGRPRRQVLARLWSGALDPAALVGIVDAVRVDGTVADTAAEIHRRAMTVVAGLLTAAPDVHVEEPVPDVPAGGGGAPGGTAGTPRVPPGDAPEGGTGVGLHLLPGGGGSPDASGDTGGKEQVNGGDTDEDPIPDDLDPAAEQIAGMIRSTGQVPGIKRIKTTVGCGDERAYRVQRQAQDLAARSPRVASR